MRMSWCLHLQRRTLHGTQSGVWSSLLLGRHLLIGVAPRADLQAAADPAKLFVGIVGNGSPFAAADGALGKPLQRVRLNGLLGLCEEIC